MNKDVQEQIVLPVNDDGLSVPLRVLLVEDDPLDVELCIKQLAKAGFELTADTVDSRESFCAKLQAHTYDVILADFGLRNWSGRDAFEILQRSGKNIPFILVTGTLGEEAAVDLIKDGVTDYVLKDRLMRLPSAVHRALQEHAAWEERKKSGEALERSEVRMRRLVESNVIGIGIGTLDGKLLDGNHAFLDLLGYTHEELFSGLLGWDTITPLEYRDTDERATQQLKFAGSAPPREKEFVRKDGSRIAVLIGGVTVVTNEGDIEAISFVVDISQRKLLEQQLRQAQKMESIGQLAGGIAHDFNNLLSVIIGYGEMILETVAQDSPTHKHAREIKKAGDRAASLTRQLLAFSRQQVLEPRILNLNDVVIDTEKMLRRLIGDGILLDTVLDRDLGSVKADQGQIGQVIMNLAINARDAMPRGGRLLIATGNVELDEMYCSQHAPVVAGQYVLLAVTDTGIGMDTQTKARIFEPFFTTKETGKGTGMGLAMVYGVVKQSGGHIWVNSEPGEGAVFNVYLPRVDDAVPLLTSSKTEIHHAGGSETILLVEDEEPVRHLICAILRQNGYHVIEARSVTHALEIAEARDSHIDLLLSDVAMPIMSGPALMEEVTPLHPEMRVLYISGYTGGFSAQLGLPGNLLQKPFSKEALLGKVRETLETKVHNVEPS